MARPPTTETPATNANAKRIAFMLPSTSFAAPRTLARSAAMALDEEQKNRRRAAQLAAAVRPAIDDDEIAIEAALAAWGRLSNRKDWLPEQDQPYRLVSSTYRVWEKGSRRRSSDRIREIAVDDCLRTE
jgi:hypothetical protein